MRSGLRAPLAIARQRGPSLGGSAAAATRTCATRSTGTMSIRAERLAGEAGDEPSAVGEQDRVGHLQPLDPAGVGLLERGLDDRRAHDREVPGPALARARARRAPWRACRCPTSRALARAGGRAPRARSTSSRGGPTPRAGRRAGAPAGPSSSWASATKRFCCSGRRDWDSSSRRHSFATASSASRSTQGSDVPLPYGRSSTRPVRWPAAYAVETWTKWTSSQPASRSASDQTARAEHVQLEDVVQRLLEGDGRRAVDRDVGAGELLRVAAAEAVGGEVRGERTQAAGGQRLVGQPAGERLARQDLLHEPLVRRRRRRARAAAA